MTFFLNKVGISKNIIRWLFSRDFGLIAVSEILPLKQGLKQINPELGILLAQCVSEILPLKQGLKLRICKFKRTSYVVSEILPLKQGLKLEEGEIAINGPMVMSQRYFH